MGSGQSSENYTISTRIDEVFHHKVHVCTYEWTVANFQDLKYTNGQYVTSQRLNIDINGTKDQWEIVLYPSGLNERTADAISIWLKRISSNERLVQFTCQISPTNLPKLKENKELITKTIKQNLTLESALGWSVFCKRSHVLNEQNGMLSGGNLILKCILEIFDDKCLVHPALEDDEKLMESTMSELSENFCQLLQNKTPGDVTFDIHGELIYAHKAILGARSKVFMAMFDFESDKDAKKIAINDISKETFISMLQFIYSGKHTRVDFDTSMELYYAADKYELISLREICSKILGSSLTTDNVVRVVILANQHGDIILRDVCVNFIAQNASEVQKREDWLNMMKSSPILANAVFHSLTELNAKNKKN